MIDPLKTITTALPTNADSRNGGGGDPAAQSPAQPAAVKPDASSQPQADARPASSENTLRLVVEPVDGGTSYTYKLFDRSTGDLVIELPREEADKLGQSPDYNAGQVINATA